MNRNTVLATVSLLLSLALHAFLFVPRDRREPVLDPVMQELITFLEEEQASTPPSPPPVETPPPVAVEPPTRDPEPEPREDPLEDDGGEEVAAPEPEVEPEAEVQEAFVRFDVSDPALTLKAALDLGIPVVFDTSRALYRLRVDPRTLRVLAADPLPDGRYFLRKLPLFAKGKRLAYADLAEQATGLLSGVHTGALALWYDDGTHSRTTTALEEACERMKVARARVRAAEAVFRGIRGRHEIVVTSVVTDDGRVFP